MLSWGAWITLVVILTAVVALVKEAGKPEHILLAALGGLLLFGILTPEEAFAGLSSSAVVAVGSLFVVSAGVQRTGAISFVDRLLFSRSSSMRNQLLRLMLTTSSLSAFLNNTPVVGMLVPRVEAWCQRTGVSPSKLMIPLSYAAIVGGTMTMIGTSTNLLVSSIMRSSGYDGLGLFTFTPIGVPLALGVILYFAFGGYRLLPDRSSTELSFDQDLKGRLFDLQLGTASQMHGRTVSEADLDDVEGARLTHLQRGEAVLASSPDLVLRSGDILTFRGNAEGRDKLLKTGELQQTDAAPDKGAERKTLPLHEVVVAPSSTLVGQTLSEADFQDRYHGVVLGLHRRDEQVEGPLEHTPIEAGDYLLIEAPERFNEDWGQRRDEFYFASSHHPAEEVFKEKAPIALLILLSVVAFAAAGAAPIATTSFLGALAMVGTGCLTPRSAFRSVDVSVLLIIAAAFGVGSAFEKVGLADLIAGGIVGSASAFGAVGVLAAIYLVTSLLTEIITNNGAAVLMIEIGLAAARDLNVPPEAFGLAVAIAGSASFMTPIGYQTNLMVMAPGGYRFADYLKTGIMANLVAGIVAVSMIWLLWLR